MKIQSDKLLERNMRIMRILSNSKEILFWMMKNLNHLCTLVEQVYHRIQRKAHLKQKNQLKNNLQSILHYLNQKIIKQKLDRNLVLLLQLIQLLQHLQQGRDRRIQEIQFLTMNHLINLA